MDYFLGTALLRSDGCGSVDLERILVVFGSSSDPGSIHRSCYCLFVLRCFVLPKDGLAPFFTGNLLQAVNADPKRVSAP